MSDIQIDLEDTPEDLLRWLQAGAAANQRSLELEIIVLLQGRYAAAQDESRRHQLDAMNTAHRPDDQP